MLLNARIVSVGPEVESLVEGGVLILFAEGAPPELAEVSVLHALEGRVAETGPVSGSTISVGNISARITAVGPDAWKKVRDIGHVVVNFNGATAAERPGEICADAVSPAELVANLKAGNHISIA